MNNLFTNIFLSCLIFLATGGHLKAAQIVELSKQGEFVVEGIEKGNLSGLAQCNSGLYTLSDKEDHFIYRLLPGQKEWIAEALPLPPLPPAQLPGRLASLINHLDFEGITCDQQGNFYLVSELINQVLKADAHRQHSEWIKPSDECEKEIRHHHLLEKFNAKFEGITVAPLGEEIWLVGERDPRGLVNLKIQGQGNNKNCVLFSDNTRVKAPSVLSGKERQADFGDITYFGGKLFTLERMGHQICRRDLRHGKKEKCWSFAKGVLPHAGYKYSNYPFGMAEALTLDSQHAWIGIDNNALARNFDKETRPIIYLFSAPSGGWLH